MSQSALAASPVRHGRVVPDYYDDRELGVAEEAARGAGAELLARFRRPLTDLHTKSGPADLVSEADLAAEDAIRETIRASYPDDTIIGEEAGERTGTSGVTWIVDPLDATQNFVRGQPCWSVSIAAADEHGLALGVVYDPVADEMFSTVRGSRIVWLNGRPAELPTFVAGRLNEAHVAAITRPTSRERALTLALAQNHAGQRRGFGSGALMCAYAAIRRLDLVYYELDSLAEWDVAAGTLLCQEAGGFAAWLDPVMAGEAPRFIAGEASIVDEYLALTSDDKVVTL